MSSPRLHRWRSGAIKAARWLRTEIRWLWWDLNKPFRKYITTNTKQGRFTLLFADEGIARAIFCHRHYERPLVETALRHLRERGLCPPRGSGCLLDVGANNGIICVGMLHMGEFERAVAVEPEPANFQLLDRNVKDNGLDQRVVRLNRAVSDREGSIQLELSPVNLGDHRPRLESEQNPENPNPNPNQDPDRRVVSVPAQTLDAIVESLPEPFRAVDLLWIDIQGFEGHAFRGAPRLLANGLPAVAEIWPEGIERSGMTLDEFQTIVARHWTHYSVLRDDRFVDYPIDTLPLYLREIGPGENYGNVVFTRQTPP